MFCDLSIVQASLQQTIVHLAQNYVGSNNVPVLVPGGQFGTRHLSGADHASARYIFTRLHPIARLLFHPDDDPLLTYREDDGQAVEPQFYLPVVPLIALNGANGLGTGFRCDVNNFHPLHVINNLRRALQDQAMLPMAPHYLGFRGEIVRVSPDGSPQALYHSRGRARRLDATRVEIDELPIGVSTVQYKALLDDMVADTKAKGEAVFHIREYFEYHTDRHVRFVVSMTKENADVAEKLGLIAAFDLERNISQSQNTMNLFNIHGRIQRFASAVEMLQEYIPIRLEYYERRRAYQLALLTAAHQTLSNKVRFIELVANGNIKLGQQRREEIETQLRAHDLPPWPTQASVATAAVPASSVTEHDDNGTEDEDTVALGDETEGNVKGPRATRFEFFCLSFYLYISIYLSIYLCMWSSGPLNICLAYHWRPCRSSAPWLDVKSWPSYRPTVTLCACLRYCSNCDELSSDRSN